MVDKWLKETYPGIDARATKEKAEIYWLDATRLNSHANDFRRGFSPIEGTSLLRMKAEYLNINIMSSISKLG